MLIELLMMAYCFKRKSWSRDIKSLIVHCGSLCVLSVIVVLLIIMSQTSNLKMLVVMSLLYHLVIGSVYGQLVGYDCAHPSNNITSISTKSVSQCEDRWHADPYTSVYGQVLYKNTHVANRIYICKIVRSSIINRCGMHSHLIAVKNALTIDEPVSITKEDCMILHTKGIYITKLGHRVEGAVVNGTITAHLIEAGSIDLDGNCEGTSFTINDITYTKAIVNSYYKISLYESMGSLRVKDNTMIIPSGPSCSYDELSCIDQQVGLIYWRRVDINPACGKSSYSLVYEGIYNITVSVVGHIVLTVETMDFRFALMLKSVIHECGCEGYNTDYPELIAIKTSNIIRPIHDTSIDIRYLNTFLNTDLKFIYIERHIYNRTTDLYQIFNKRYCELNKNQLSQLLSLARTNPDEFAYVYTGLEGYTALLRGEAIHLIQCAKQIVSPRPTSDCYNEMPVIYKNSSYFIRPTDRVLVRVGTPVLCSNTVPVLFQIGGQWAKIGGESYMAQSPKVLKPDDNTMWEYGELVSMKHMGFLSDAQVEAYREAIIQPLERKAISDTFAARVSTHGYISSQGLDFNAGIDAKEITDEIADTVITRLYGAWNFVIKHLGAIFGLAILWNLFWSLVELLINGFLLYKKYGFSPVIFIAIWSAMAKHKLYYNFEKEPAIRSTAEQKSDGDNRIVHYSALKHECAINIENESNQESFNPAIDDQCNSNDCKKPLQIYPKIGTIKYDC